ncbi:pyrimidine 5'-nucleotidase [Cupriavidus plantarum]|uniref:pyrimidine 5'-nucleotidase n=1 Tax=Cupriavidus plantarum TaxID=942865 RepID=UPI0035C6D856
MNSRQPISRRAPTRTPRTGKRLAARLVRRPAGNLSGATVWLFDLDNTLHDASHAIFPAINRLMTEYVARVLDTDEATASRVRVDYWQRYGATLLGMIRHHGVDADDFLRAAHEFPELEGMLRVQRGLAAHLRRLPGRKILITNAPRDYARAVMTMAGIDRFFERVIAVEDMWVHGHLRPKPDRRMLRRWLARARVPAHRAVLVEDTLSHLKHYAATGIRNAWITGHLRTLAPAARDDAAVRATLAEEDARHAAHVTQERSVTLVAAESQIPPNGGRQAGEVGTSDVRAPQSQPDSTPRVRARVVNRPRFVNIKVQSLDHLIKQSKGIGS